MLNANITSLSIKCSLCKNQVVQPYSSNIRSLNDDTRVFMPLYLSPTLQRNLFQRKFGNICIHTVFVLSVKTRIMTYSTAFTRAMKGLWNVNKLDSIHNCVRRLLWRQCPNAWRNIYKHNISCNTQKFKFNSNVLLLTGTNASWKRKTQTYKTLKISLIGIPCVYHHTLTHRMQRVQN